MRAHITHIKTHLQPNECLLILDFGGHHNLKMVKVYQLGFVLFRYDSATDSVVKERVSIFGTPPNTSPFVQASYNKLHENNHFKDVKTLYRAGDVGNHFRGLETYLFEQTMYEKWGIRVKVRQLPGNHLR
jgi:hypothetical protein